jgi:hypothetical protein
MNEHVGRWKKHVAISGQRAGIQNLQYSVALNINRNSNSMKFKFPKHLNGLKVIQLRKVYYLIL